MGLKVKFYDVEHGSCTHIITPNGKHLLFDIGSKNDSSICKYLRNKYFVNCTKPDALVITHPHLDHISDLENMYYYDILPSSLWRDERAFPLQVTRSDSQAQINLKNCVNRMNNDYSGTIDESKNPKNANNNGGVVFTRFMPTLTYSEYSDLNNFSCITAVEYCGFKIILTGDNPAKKLLELLDITDFRRTITDATVLLAPHHGRDNEFCSDFVSVVNPRVTVFSDKPIVHETQAHSAQKYANATRGVSWNGDNRKVFTTRNDGTIIFEFGDHGWSINTNSTEY